MRLWILALVLSGCEMFSYDPDVGLLEPVPPDAGMSDGGPQTTGKCGDSNPGAAVSFSHDVRPLTTRSPGGCGCHQASTTSGFNLGSYESLRRGGMISGTHIIVPGDPCASILVQKLGLAPPFGSRMPYNGPPYFSATELQLVRDWIAEGAQNN